MPENLHPLAFWTTAIKYLHLAEVVTGEMIKQGNPWVVVTPYEISEEELSEKTKWSDFNIAVPLLFNFYHGLELLLKGYILTKGELRHIHKISELYSRFCELFPENPIIELLKPYTTDIEPSSVLGEFLSSNEITIDEYYQALKYPTSTKRANYFHRPLQYNTEVGLQFFKALNDHIQKLRRQAVTLGRSLDQNA